MSYFIVVYILCILIKKLTSASREDLETRLSKRGNSLPGDSSMADWPTGLPRAMSHWLAEVMWVPARHYIYAEAVEFYHLESWRDQTGHDRWPMTKVRHYIDLICPERPVQLYTTRTSSIPVGRVCLLFTWSSLVPVGWPIYRPLVRTENSFVMLYESQRVQHTHMSLVLRFLMFWTWMNEYWMLNL